MWKILTLYNDKKERKTMNKKKMIRMTLMMLLVACFLFAYPTVAHAASEAGGEIGSGIGSFLRGILDCLVMICEGVIGIFIALIDLLVYLVNLIIGLFK